MKDKILASLRNKYRNLGLSDKITEGIADLLALTTTEESQIETAVAGVENLAKGFQGDADRIRTEATQKAKAEQQKAQGGEQQKQEPTNDDVPAWAKGFTDKIASLTEELTAIKKGKTTSTRKEVLEQKLKDAPAAIKAKTLKDFERMQFETDDDFNAYLTETETDLGVVVQEFANKGLAAHQSPVVGGGATEASLDAEIKAWSGAGNK